MTTGQRRPALGQVARIGNFYDAKKDRFMSESLLDNNLPDAAFSHVEQKKTEATVHHGDDYRSRFETLDMSWSLRGSFLASSMACDGAGRYMSEPRQEGSLHATLQHTMTTCKQTLNFAFEGLRHHLRSSAVLDTDATHVVTGVEWGSKSVISMHAYPPSGVGGAAAQSQFDTLIATLVSRVEALGDSALPPVPVAPTDTALPTTITMYSEMFEDNDGILLEDPQEAFEFLEMMALHVKSENEGKGWPIVYELFPVEMLHMFLPIQQPQLRQINYPATDLLESAIILFDQYLVVGGKLKIQQSRLSDHAQYMPRRSQHEIEERLRRLETSQRRFGEEFARTLSSVKAGFMDAKELREVVDHYQQGDLSPETIGAVSASDGEALDFVLCAVAAGAVYVGHNGLQLGSILPVHKDSEAYVFYFSHAAMRDEQSWKENVDLFESVLQERSSASVVAIVDCDALSSLLDTARIAQYQAGSEITPDLLAHRKFMANNCFAECDDRVLETADIQPPTQRRHVTIPCPGSKCSVAKVHEWLCPRCMAPIEYGFTDQYIYCACGRALHGNYRFKCSSESHGPHFTPHDPPALLRLLDNLVQTNYLNILILGETGVGKSTFINAMVNYLEFDTLDEALAADKLNWVIPCSFSTQVMDRTDPSRPIEQKHIKIGTSDDERDGSKGDSATQRTTVYPVTFQHGDSTLTVRLIDTPGIGDSRGVDADKQNMADVLSTLSGYDHVHGILILLKSNNARLTITFRYCVKELLTHLHHDAASNMAFGFTNTRISNYTPGDTFLPMQTLLDQHPDVGLKLHTPTTYCFDSESFRYLAASKRGVEMPNKIDFDRSWERSREETLRLISRFQSLQPHEVKSTLSLNGARQLISELTKPLAEISQTINTNINLVEDQVQLLKTKRIKGDELRNMLHVQKIQMNAETLDQPRTVCGDQACTEVRDDGRGQNTMVIIYKSHCHPVCYLNDVQADVMAHPSLINCATFSGSSTCITCRHHWQQHLHVLYELHEETITVIDDGIQRQLATHADEITLQKTAVKQKERLVEEYRKEREVIRDAAARFCVFLKNKSIAPYNDALVAYLDFLIKEEQAKVQAGGSDKRLLSLTLERQKHTEAIEVLTRHMDGHAVAEELDEGGVDRLVKGLYGLEHFGENLKQMKQGITAAHQATYREKPVTVRRRHQSGTAAKIAQQTPVNAPTRFGQGRAPARTPSVLVKGNSLPATSRTHAPSSASGGIVDQVKKLFSS